MPIETLTNTPGEPLTADYHLIKSKMPSWLIEADDAHRQAFKRADSRHLDWLAGLTAEQRDQLKQYHERSAASQRAVDQAMAALQDAEAFARPLLAQALLEQFGLDADLDKTFVHLNRPIALGVFGIRVGKFSVLTLSLLQAALHNFEEAECEADAFDVSSSLRQGRSAQDAALDTRMSVHGFLGLCRRLDVGGQYQRHLKDFLHPVDTGSIDTLRAQVITAQKDALQAAAYLALLRHDIEANDYAVVQAVLDDRRDIRDDGKPVWFADLCLMGLRLSGCTVLMPVEKYRYGKQVLVYIPHDPEHPLKKYPNLQALQAELTRQLMADDGTNGGPSRYQHFLANFIAYADQPTYYRRLTQDAADSPGDPYGAVRIARYFFPFVSAFINVLISPTELPPKPPPSREPIKDPNFHIAVLSKRGLWEENVELWQDNFDKLRDKLIADARSHAVPTADVDARVRAARIAALLQGGLFALNLVSMFVPVLGEVMMGVMAGQLLYETFEGVIEWAEDDREAALEHLTDVAENLAMLAVMAAGGAGLRMLLKTPPVIEGMKPVTLASGEQKLWKTDLAPYKAPIRLAPDATPDTEGLYTHNGRKVLRLEGDHYWVNKDYHNGENRIQHPDRPDAYAPLLEHNYEGAWHHEAEEPLTWDGDTLLRRLGMPAEALDTGARQQALIASGLDTDALRAAQINHEAVPRVLAESLKRLRIQHALRRFIEQIKSPEPAQYAKADLPLQLDILKRRGLLPDRPPLRVYDNRGITLWDDPAPKHIARDGVVINDLHVARGEQLHALLAKLQVKDPLLKDMPGHADDPLTVRAQRLRALIGEHVERFQDALAQERYLAQDASADADVTRLQGRYQRLPTPFARHLLDLASPEELQGFRQTGELSPRLAEQAQWFEHETRVSRAYEDLFCEAQANLDSQRLALRTLETLPGWRRGTRLELRQDWAEGPVLDAIGSPDLPARHLLLDEHGAATGDLYETLWQLLTPDERHALNTEAPHQLKALIHQAPLPRGPLRSVLWEQPLRKPAYDPSMRLLGGGRGVKQLLASSANLFRTPQARLQRLFPDFDEAQVEAFLQALGDGVGGELARLESEYATLKADLKHWLTANAPAGRVDRFHAGRMAADEIKRGWRRQTLTMKIGGEQPLNLPALTADFSHIQELNLYNTPWTSDTDVLLGRFKQLQCLNIAACGLKELPQAVGRMQNLRQLRLRGGAIRLTPQSIEQLAGLTQLEELDLRGNPLSLPPDFSAMPRLKFVDLSEAGLEQWPAGLRDQTDLQRLDLSCNELRTIPLEYLEPAAERYEQTVRINSVTHLLNNPLAPETYQALDAYWRRLTQAHPEWVTLGGGDNFTEQSPTATKVRRMFPHFGPAKLREYIWSLGEDAELQVDRLTEEHDQLRQQLNAWAFSGGGERQRYVRMGQVLENVGDRGYRHMASARILSCWRRETPQVHARDGTPIGLELNLSGLRLQSLPDLDADFSHVGSLKLSDMNLSASPEGFLARYRGLRRLDLSRNQLQALPPAVGEMHGLTSLFLEQNQIRLTPETAEILAGRTTLRALWLDHNPLSITPDFSRIPDMRSLRLNATGIDTWPTGLAEQPLLDTIDLSDNQLTSIPQSLINPEPAQLAQSARLSKVTNVARNPFPEQTLQQIRAYGERLAQQGHIEVGNPDLLVASALNVRAAVARVRSAGAAFTRWARELPAEQVAARQTQWLELREQPRGQGFFRMLGDLESEPGAHADLQRRVWDVIDSITARTVESAALREQMFEWAGRPACCDRAGLSFSNVEVMAMVYRARASATGEGQGAALMKLARGLFRLDEVDRTALADIAARTAEINGRPGLFSSQRTGLIANLEEVEIRLAYRMGLKDANRLDLPGQPQSARFTRLGKVSQETLDATCQRILALDDSPQAFEALVARDFWQDYITHRYRPQFEAQSQPYHEQLAALYERVQATTLSETEYAQQAADLQARLAIEESALIQTLTRQELEAHPQV